MSRRATWAVVGWLLAILVIAAFTMLGSWQLGRQHDKQATLDAVAATLAARAARPLSVAADTERAQGYDWASGRGHFAEAPALLLDNQQRGGRSGVRAYRVFIPQSGTPLLVELGWLPVPGDRRMPDVPRPRGEFEVAGMLAPPPSRGIGGTGLAAAPGDSGALLAIGLVPSELAAAMGQPRLAARVLRLDPDLPLGYARDLDMLANTLPPERHLGYAVQWFALAAAMLVIALILSFRRTRR
ncbi:MULTISPECIES: SURF1 family protein [unclassified Luteimonas]|uniref:SURF1 family protein n=1 Tax=unclassified Luteimonas TaxID=2629088 RepID=UPI001CC4500E|nr:SURF1 family protein [Luteimonas sp. MC1825]